MKLFGHYSLNSICRWSFNSICHCSLNSICHFLWICIFFDGWCFGAIKYFKTFLQLGTWNCHMRQHLHTTLLWWCHREGFHESSPMNIKCPNNHHNTINTSFFPSLDFSTTECTIFRLVCRLSPKLNCHCLPRHHHQDHRGGKLAGLFCSLADKQVFWGNT